MASNFPRLPRWLGILARNRIDFQARELYYTTLYNDRANSAQACLAVENLSTRGRSIGIYAIGCFSTFNPPIYQVAIRYPFTAAPNTTITPLYASQAAIEAGVWTGEDLANPTVAVNLDASDLRWQSFGGAPMFILPPGYSFELLPFGDGNYQQPNSLSFSVNVLFGYWQEH